MTRLLRLIKTVFFPRDGTRRLVAQQIATSSRRIDAAANRFETTIREVLDRNDTLTGRRHAQSD